MQSHSELALQCCDCANHFTSATGLLRHFAEHVARDRRQRRRVKPSSASATETASESSQSRQSSTDSCGEDSTSAPHCKLARFDLQKRLETCVSEAIKTEPAEISGKEDEDSSPPPSPDNKAADEYSPLKFCMITMEEEEKSTENMKKAAGRKQLVPKKIEQKTEPLRKLAPKPEGTSTLEALLQPGKKKYACHLCNKVFGWSTDLKRHILVHTGERPFKCKTCQATFTRNFLLQKHQSKVHPCKPKDFAEPTKPKIAKDDKRSVKKEVKNKEYVTLFSVKEEPIDERELEDDDDDEDKLVITEDIDVKSTIASLPPESKWKDRRCSDLKRSEMFNVTPIKVMTM